MRDCDHEKEDEFFRLVLPFYNLESTPVRAYSESEYSLARMEPLFALMGHPEKRLKVIHIAGTKGKGTTCFYLAALLKSAGKTTGIFSSPHVSTVRERFWVDGELIDYDTLLEETAKMCQKITTETTLKPSLFEIMTVLACVLFLKKGCEYAILETGIGGLLDATNYVEKPLACGIASISFDHKELLGETIVEIARQKGGIIKPGVPVVGAAQPFAEAEQTIAEIAQQKGAPLVQLKTGQYPVEMSHFLDETTPEFLKENFSTAWAICQLLSIQPDANAFETPILKARFEVIRRTPPIILDAAHNRNSAARLCEALQQTFPETRFCVVLGIVPGKDFTGIIDELIPIIQTVILTDPKTTKGTLSGEISDYLTAKNISFRYCPELTKNELPTSEPILFTGSFYTAVIGDEFFF